MPAIDDVVARSRRRLIAIDVAAIVTMLVHDGDHLRQAAQRDYDVPVHVLVIFGAAFLPLTASLFWAYRGRLRLAVLAAAPVLAGVLVLLSSVHLIGVEQFWAPLGDVLGLWATGYGQLHVDALSWAAFALLFFGYAYLLGQLLDVGRDVRAAVLPR